MRVFSGRAPARFFIFGAALIAIAAGAFLFSGDNKVVIGVILPFSGPGNVREAALAQEAGVLLAEEGIRAGRYGEGKELTILFRDSVFEPERGAETARELVDLGADALYSSFTVVTRGVSSEAVASRTPLFYDSCNCGFAEENPYAFQMYFDPRKECRAVAEQFRDVGTARALYVGSDVPYGKFCYDNLIGVFGEEHVELEFERAGVMKRYEALIRSAVQRGAGVIVSTPAVRDYAELFRANVASGSPLPIICFRGDCVTERIVEESSAESLSHVYAFDFSISDDFTEQILARHPEFTVDDISQAAIAHDAVVHGWKGASACGRRARCIGKVTRDGGYPTAILSSGFGEDKILQYETRYVRVEGGKRLETAHPATF